MQSRFKPINADHCRCRWVKLGVKLFRVDLEIQLYDTLVQKSIHMFVSLVWLISSFSFHSY